MKRKVLSVLLALSMILAMIPVMSMATEGEPDISINEVTVNGELLKTAGEVTKGDKINVTVTASAIDFNTSGPAIKVVKTEDFVENINSIAADKVQLEPQVKSKTATSAAFEIDTNKLEVLESGSYTIIAVADKVNAYDTFEFTVVDENNVVVEPSKEEVIVTVEIKTKDVTTGSAVSTVDYTATGDNGEEVTGIMKWYVSHEDRTEVTNFQSEEGTQTLSYIFVANDTDDIDYLNCEGDATFNVVANSTKPSNPSYGGGGGSSTPATDNTVEVETTVEGDTVVVEIDEKALAKELETIAADSAVTTVTIDLSDVGADVVQAELPAAAIEAIAAVLENAANNIDSVEIALPAGSITLDLAALTEVLGQAGAANIVVTVNNIGTEGLNEAQASASAGLGVEGVFDIGIGVKGGAAIENLGGGKATIGVPWKFPAGIKAAGYMVKHIDLMGVIENMLTEPSVSEGFMRWVTPHFSTYVVTYSEANIECDGGEGCPSAAFSDVESGQWYHLAIDFAIENGLMQGMGDGTFAPNACLTRAQLVQILFNDEGKPELTTESGITFSDVADGAWYADAVEWAAAEGIVMGYEDGTFAPDKHITREELVTLIYRAVGAPEATGSLAAFTDAAQVQAYAVDAMTWAVANGIINGMGDGTVAPAADASRAQIAQIFMNLDANF